MEMNQHTDIKYRILKTSYNNKGRKLLKIHFFINLRKKIIFLRAHFCVIKQKFGEYCGIFMNIMKRVTYSLTNNISHDHICYSMCNVNMLIIVPPALLSMMCLYSMVFALIES